ncbi:sulfatase-like hydrolase/transferase [Pseudorhodoferax sp.]|uniref:sulfatase-like hydrolase/transferase n=1 Tax=Pseudorhodoferax sp. TaxID=1993553 RepID=UPI0039E315B5
MTSPAATRPNVLFLMVDQWAGPLFGHAGHPVIQTPTIDQLARLGTRFPHAYSESPICIPARRSVMTGLSPRGHGDRSFLPAEPMPRTPLLAQCFRNAGYQAQAIGKLHVFPQRDRVGFDDALLAEEGRPGLGAVDDYDLFLADRGQAGQQFMHGMSNNGYEHRPWHLDESLHVTNWITQAAARAIKRRDPTRPAFWHVSYSHPHPPLVPLSAYLDLYRDAEIDLPVAGNWSRPADRLPSALQVIRNYWPAPHTPATHRALRRAYYALCTHIDHQIRVLIGTLREEGLLDDTVILLTCDHGDMLGDHGLWAKRLFYEGSARVPMILVGTRHCERVAQGGVDTRLVGLQDVMPTLLDMAGIAVPDTVEGLSMVGEQRREILYGECGEQHNASRMVHDGRYKLIWYPAGSVVQLFDLANDPRELHDLSTDAAPVRRRLEEALIASLYGDDLRWVQGGRVAGYAPEGLRLRPDRMLSGQRGVHYPQPPVDHPDRTAIRPA